MKQPEAETFKDRRLIDWLADLPRGRTPQGASDYPELTRCLQQNP
jgi:hypothetical protein